MLMELINVYQPVPQIKNRNTMATMPQSGENKKITHGKWLLKQIIEQKHAVLSNFGCSYYTNNTIQH